MKKYMITAKFAMDNVYNEEDLCDYGRAVLKHFKKTFPKGFNLVDIKTIKKDIIKLGAVFNKATKETSRDDFSERGIIVRMKEQLSTVIETMMDFDEKFPGLLYNKVYHSNGETIKEYAQEIENAIAEYYALKSKKISMDVIHTMYPNACNLGRAVIEALDKKLGSTGVLNISSPKHAVASLKIVKKIFESLNKDKYFESDDNMNEEFYNTVTNFFEVLYENDSDNDQGYRMAEVAGPTYSVDDQIEAWGPLF